MESNSNRKRKSVGAFIDRTKASHNAKAFTEFRKTLEDEIESTLLKKMRTFTDDILKSRLR